MGADDEVGGAIDKVPVIDVGEVVEVVLEDGVRGFFVLMNEDEEGEKALFVVG